jgi:small-conductance mechanosensitive channel
MLGATAAELFGACILVFIKHPYDIGDRVTINSRELIVDKISLLYTEFRRIDNNALVQIPNNVNNANWIDNITKSKAMK